MVNGQKNVIDKILGDIDHLSEEDRSKLISKLTPAVTIIFCGSSLVSHGAAVQINGNSEELKKLLTIFRLKV